VKLLQLFIITSHKRSIIPTINPNPVSSHKHMTIYCDMMPKSRNSGGTEDVRSYEYATVLTHNKIIHYTTQQLGKNVSAATNTHASKDELLEAVRCMRSVSKLYKKSPSAVDHISRTVVLAEATRNRA
jgi:hypothetical protein